MSMIFVLGIYCVTEAVSIMVEGYTTTGLATLKSYKLRWPSNLLFFVRYLPFYICVRA